MDMLLFNGIMTIRFGSQLLIASVVELKIFQNHTKNHTTGIL